MNHLYTTHYTHLYTLFYPLITLQTSYFIESNPFSVECVVLYPMLGNCRKKKGGSIYPPFFFSTYPTTEVIYTHYTHYTPPLSIHRPLYPLTTLQSPRCIDKDPLCIDGRRCIDGPTKKKGVREDPQKKPSSGIKIFFYSPGIDATSSPGNDPH